MTVYNRIWQLTQAKRCVERALSHVSPDYPRRYILTDEITALELRIMALLQDR